MKRLKNSQAYVLLESLVGFLLISSLLLIFNMSLTQFYQRERVLMLTISNLQQVDSAIVKQQPFLTTQDVTMHYNSKEVIIDEGDKTYTISMEE